MANRIGGESHYDATETAGAVARGLDNLADEVQELREARPSLRDQFAMAALAGMLSDEWPVEEGRVYWVSQKAYEYADAMLAARVPVSGREGE